MTMSAVALAGGIAAAAHAQTQRQAQPQLFALLRAEEPRTMNVTRGFSLPSSVELRPSGAIERRRGMIAAFDVGPAITVGVGLFRMKVRPATGDEPEAGTKSRKVAIGGRLRF